MAAAAAALLAHPWAGNVRQLQNAIEQAVALAREAAIEAVRRIMPRLDLEAGTIPPEVLDELQVTREDFVGALKRVHPSAMREVMVQVPDIRWSDIGGVGDAHQPLAGRQARHRAPLQNAVRPCCMEGDEFVRGRHGHQRFAAHFLKALAPVQAGALEHQRQLHAALVQQAQGIGLLGGQDVFTVPGLTEKLEAQLRGIGVGFLPECLARPYIDAGRLVAPPVARKERIFHISYAWRKTPAPAGKALAWWQAHLADPVTRKALLG